MEFTLALFATVAAITGTGTVFAVNAQGVSRALKVGDTLEKGETVRTVGDARVELMMEDGQLMAVAPAQSLRLDENVVQSEQRPTAQDSALTTPATSDTVIQALERGTDLNQTLDATAAGLGGGGGADGGSTFVQLLRITEGVDPLSYNYSYSGTSQNVVVPAGADATTTTLQLSADGAVTEGGAGVTYTATLGSPAFTDMTITLSNGAVIVIGAGASSGTVVVPVRGEDVYKTTETLTTTVGTVEGGGYTTITVNDANVVTVVNDTITPVTVDLTASTGVAEGGGAAYTFTATLSAASQGVTTVVTNQGIITIADGQTTGTLVVAAANGEDVYKDASSLQATIQSASGGNFEQINIGAGSATATIVDSTNTIVVSISADGNVTEAAAANFTVSVSQSLDRDLAVTLSNGAVVTIAAGSTSVSYSVPAQGDDVYTDPGSVTIGLASAAVAGAVFENLVLSAPATVQISDTVDSTKATLTGVLEGGQIIYTVTLDSPVRAGDAPVVVTLSNGESITIAAGSSGSTSISAPTDGTAAVTASIASVTQVPGGDLSGSFEFLLRDEEVLSLDMPKVTPTFTITVTGEVTSTVSGVVTDTITGVVTDTVSGVVTQTVSGIVTETIPHTATVTLTDTVTSTSTSTYTETVTYSATSSHTDTIVSGTDTFTGGTHTVEDTATITTGTHTVENTVQVTDTVTDTAHATDTVTDTAQVTDMVTDTALVTHTVTDTAHATDTVTDTAHATVTLTDTALVTHNVTDTAHATDTVTDTSHATLTVTDTAVLTHTITETVNDTTTATVSATVTETFNTGLGFVTAGGPNNSYDLISSATPVIDLNFTAPGSKAGVNTNNGFMGVDNLWLDPKESLVISFQTGPGSEAGPETVAGLHMTIEVQGSGTVSFDYNAGAGVVHVENAPAGDFFIPNTLSSVTITGVAGSFRVGAFSSTASVPVVVTDTVTTTGTHTVTNTTTETVTTGTHTVEDTATITTGTHTVEDTATITTGTHTVTDANDTVTTGTHTVVNDTATITTGTHTVTDANDTVTTGTHTVVNDTATISTGTHTVEDTATITAGTHTVTDTALATGTVTDTAHVTDTVTDTGTALHTDTVTHTDTANLTDTVTHTDTSILTDAVAHTDTTVVGADTHTVSTFTETVTVSEYTETVTVSQFTETVTVSQFTETVTDTFTATETTTDQSLAMPLPQADQALSAHDVMAPADHSLVDPTAVDPSSTTGHPATAAFDPLAQDEVNRLLQNSHPTQTI